MHTIKKRTGGHLSARVRPAHTPPDAGASYLGTYGLTNPWVAWLVSRAPQLVASTPQALGKAGLRRPPCPSCGEPMALRVEKPKRRRRGRKAAKAARLSAGGAWKCYNWRHAKPVVVVARLEADAAPDYDVVAAIREGNPILDYIYADLLDGLGARWIVVADGMADS